PLPAGSCARVQTGDHAEAPPLPPPREPGSPPVCTPGVQRAGWCTTGRHANREARPGGPPSFAHRSDTHTRAALVCKAEGTGEPHGKGTRKPERRPSHSCTGATRERTGSDWEGVCATGCARASGEWGAHPLRVNLCAEQRAGARGHKRRHAGGLYGMERTQ
ncbi:hypothetical protein EDB85DRAFT_1946880, partial [Lactarius pseudohatsudake]